MDAWIWERVDPIGIGAGVGAALFLAIYLLVIDHLGGDLHPLTIAAYPMGMAALLLMPLARWGPMDLPASKWWWLLALGVLGTALPALLEVAAVRYAGPGPVGMIILTQPVFGAVSAWFLLGQTLTALQIIGIAVSLAGGAHGPEQGLRGALVANRGSVRCRTAIRTCTPVGMGSVVPDPLPGHPP